MFSVSRSARKGVINIRVSHTRIGFGGFAELLEVILRSKLLPGVTLISKVTVVSV